MAQPRAGKDAGGESNDRKVPQDPPVPPARDEGEMGGQEGSPDSRDREGREGEEKRGVAAALRLLSSSTVVLKCAPTLPLARPLARLPAAQPL